MSTEELITKVEHLRSLLSAYATSDVYSYRTQDYPTIRRELLADPRLRSYVPEFVQKCRDLSDFWQFIKGEFAHYAERRAFIREQFHPLLTALEEEYLGSPSDQAHSLILLKVDSVHVQATWQRALERRSSDPEGAITSARTLLEAVVSTSSMMLEPRWRTDGTYRSSTPRRRSAWTWLLASMTRTFSSRYLAGLNR